MGPAMARDETARHPQQVRI